MRDILIDVLEETEACSDREAKILGLRLLSKIGTMTKNGEILMMACYYQLKYKINITKEVNWVLQMEECIARPEPYINPSDFVCKMSFLKEKLSMSDNDDMNGQINLTQDAFAASETHYFNFSEFRGMTRAIRGYFGEWKKVDMANDEQKDLKSVSMVIHKGQLLVRHEGIKEKPFVEYDKETLKPISDSDFSFFEEEKEDDRKLKKLNWSEEEIVSIPAMENSDGEEEPAQTTFRKIDATPLASDGTYIYALSASIKKSVKLSEDEEVKETLKQE